MTDIPQVPPFTLLPQYRQLSDKLPPWIGLLLHQVKPGPWWNSNELRLKP